MATRTVITFAALFLLCPTSVRCRHGGWAATPFRFPPTLKKATSRHHHHHGESLFRGGAEDPEEFVPSLAPESEIPSSVEVGSVVPCLDVASILIHVFGGVNAFHGIILSLLPSVGTKLLGTSGADDPDAAYAEEAIGAFALEYGVTGYLAATGIVDPETAIACGTLPDLFFLAKNLIKGKFAEFGVQNLMSVMTLAAASCTAAIFSDNLHLGPVIEILAIMPAIQGGAKYFDPIRAGKKMMGTDLSENPVAKALYRHSGQMKIVSAVLRGAIAFGVKPLKAVGYASCANALLILDSTFRCKSPDDIGKKKAFYHQMGSLGLSLVMGAVFVLKSDD